MASIDILQSGKYRVRVSRGRGLPLVSACWTPAPGWSQRTIEKELARFAADFERRVKAGEILTKAETREREREAAARAAKAPTVRDYAAVYMKAKESTLARNSLDGYQRLLDNWILPAIGDRKIADITSDDIDALLADLKKEGRAYNSCVKCYAVLNNLFKRARKKGVIASNPMELVDRPTPRENELIDEEPDSCTAEEARYVLECLEREPLKWRTYIRLLIDTGCRRGEIAALRWTAIDFSTGELAIRENALYNKTFGSYTSTPKSKRARTVYIGPEALELLREMRREQTRSGISQYVFPKRGDTSSPMFPTSPDQYFSKFSRRYGVAIYPHKLRHTFASLAITNGGDVASVSENLGHADKSTTLRMYTDANRESRKRASSAVWNAIKNEDQPQKKNA